MWHLGLFHTLRPVAWKDVQCESQQRNDWTKCIIEALLPHFPTLKGRPGLRLSSNLFPALLYSTSSFRRKLGSASSDTTVWLALASWSAPLKPYCRAPLPAGPRNVAHPFTATVIMLTFYNLLCNKSSPLLPSCLTTHTRVHHNGSSANVCNSIPAHLHKTTWFLSAGWSSRRKHKQGDSESAAMAYRTLECD